MPVLIKEWFSHISKHLSLVESIEPKTSGTGKAFAKMQENFHEPSGDVKDRNKNTFIVARLAEGLNQNLTCTLDPEGSSAGSIRLGQLNVTNFNIPVFLAFRGLIAHKDNEVWRLLSPDKADWYILFRLSQGELKKYDAINRSKSGVGHLYYPQRQRITYYMEGTGERSLQYEAAGLVALDNRASSLLGYQYQECINAVAKALGNLEVFFANPNDTKEVDRFVEVFINPEVQESQGIETQKILEGLIGFSENLTEDIRAALQQKRHLILYGPPGTGKTSLAKRIAGALGAEASLFTASSDWSSHDVIGGYMPNTEGRLEFTPGFVLANFEKVVIIDEFNRADIDKAFGPLFSLLTGHKVTLPYRLGGRAIEILPEYPDEPIEEHQFAPEPQWRILATLNTYDKTSLFQMSYALSRRFAWVFVDIPRDLDGFIREYALIKEHAAEEDLPPTGEHTLIAKLWEVTNDVRPLGPACFIDLIEFIKSRSPKFEIIGTSVSKSEHLAVLLSGLEMYIAPLLEGISTERANFLIERIWELLGGETNNLSGQEWSERFGNFAKLIRANAI